MIVTSAWVLIVICLVIIGMDRTSIFGIPFAEGSNAPDILFYICGALIGAAGGTIQAASRTMMVFHTTADRSAEAFGLYALSGKATAFIAPFAIAMASSASGSQRIGISPLILLFLILCGYNPVTDLLSRWASPTVVQIVASFSVMTHFDAFQRGIIDFRDLLFFASVIGFALFTTGVIIRGLRAG